jgi:glycosyltransferase involved in cell wall biosynthesis
MKNNYMSKIIYCITKSNWGGAQKYVYDLATNIPNSLVVVGSDGLLVKKLREQGIRVIVLGEMGRDISLLKDIKSFFKLLKIFKEEKPDVVHLNSSKMGLVGAVAGRLARVKIIFTAHGWAFNEDRSLLQRKILYILHWLNVLLAHKTIAVSYKTKEQMRNKKIFVIHNGIGKIDFYSREEARERLGLTGKVIGTIAELHKNKGLEYLIEASKSLPFTFAIIGDGELKLPTRPNVLMLGRIEDASRYLKAFDMFLLPSITEALPYVLLEARQAGIPIVATRVGGIPELLSGTISPRSPQEIIDAIEGKDPFTLENMIKQTQKLYER